MHALLIKVPYIYINLWCGSTRVISILEHSFNQWLL